MVTVTDSISVETLRLSAIDGDPGRTDDEFTELVPSARGVRLTTDREGLRRLAAEELGLPTAPFWFVGSVGELEDVAADAGFPLLLKPVAGAAGGASVVAGPDDIELAWHLAVGPGGRATSACWPKRWSTSNSRSACSPCAPTARPVR